jgi:hypothetical protein
MKKKYGFEENADDFFRIDPHDGRAYLLSESDTTRGRYWLSVDENGRENRLTKELPGRSLPVTVESDREITRTYGHRPPPGAGWEEIARKGTLSFWVRKKPEESQT